MKIPKLPAPLATFLLRIPLSVLFFQQGLSKFPVNEATAKAFGLPFIVWCFVFSSIPMMDNRGLERREDYLEYMKETPSLLPFKLLRK